MEAKMEIASSKYQVSCPGANRHRRHHLSTVRQPVPPAPGRFNFGFGRRRPLVPVSAAAMFLNMDTQEVLALIDGGGLRWAFDIRSRDAERREVRVWRQSLFDYTGLGAVQRPGRPEGSAFQRVMDQIFPEETIVRAGEDAPETRPSCRGSRNFQVEMRVKPDIYRQMKVPKEPVLRCIEVAESFCCNPQHVLNLLAENLFQRAKVPLGVKASPLLTRASVINFLKERRLS
jgi:hypothetical protein